MVMESLLASYRKEYLSSVDVLKANMTQSNFVKCQQKLKSLEMEVHHLESGSKEKSGAIKEIKGFKLDLRRMKGMMEKKELMQYGDESDSPDGDVDYGLRKKLQETEMLLQDSDRKLEKSLQMIAKSEQMGVETLSSLASQRNQMINARGQLRDINSDLSESNRILERLRWRRIYTRICIVGMVAVFAIVLLILLYVQLIKPIVG